MSPVHSAPPSQSIAPPATAIHLLVEPPDAGLRIDELLAARLGVGRRAAARLVEAATHNGRPPRKGDRVAAGDEVVLHGALPFADPQPAEVARGGEPVAPGGEPSVVRLEDDFALLDKPAGLPSVALIGRAGASVAAFASARFPECARLGAPGECGLVHRLDTQTSGLLILARSDRAYHALREQFEEHRVEKSYLAIVEGDVAAPFSIDAPIGQHPKSRRRMRAVLGAKAIARYRARPASTAIEPIERLGPATLVRAVTQSGARHQIRVHLAHAGHPLVADTLYGGEVRAGIPALLLHAERVSFDHPTTGEPIAHSLAEPEGFAAAWRALGSA